MAYTSPMARKPKASHPWKAWNPNQFKRSVLPHGDTKEFKGTTKTNRAR